MLEIKFHGGECCGIKHITGFWGNPSDKHLAKAESKKRLNDASGDSVQSDWNFCWEALPQQTYKERLVAYIDFLKKARPSGLIEVSLTPIQLVLYGWAPVLDELGFKKMCEFWNSNSAEKISVFFLVYGGKECAIDAYNEEYEDEDSIW